MHPDACLVSKNANCVSDAQICDNSSGSGNCSGVNQGWSEWRARESIDKGGEHRETVLTGG